MHACFHEEGHQWQKHLLLYSWVSALSLEIYIFLTSAVRCHIVSHFAGSACEARRLLASKVKWAGPWVIDEAATILKISITKAEESMEQQYNNANTVRWRHQIWKWWMPIVCSDFTDRQAGLHLHPLSPCAESLFCTASCCFLPACLCSPCLHCC